MKKSRLLLLLIKSDQVRKFSTNFLHNNQKVFIDESNEEKKINTVLPNNNNLIYRMENCIKQAHSCSRLKKEKDLQDCLIDLKNYCLQLDEKTERRLSEANWNYLIQHFAKQEDFEELAIHWYKTIIIDKKIANANSYTLGTMLKLFSNRGELEQSEQLFEKLRMQNECSLFTYSQYVNACIKRNNLEKALNLIIEMKRNNIEPNHLIFIPMLKAATATNNQTIGLKMLKLIDKSNSVSKQVSMCVIKFALQAKIPEKVIEECEKLKRNKLMTIITWSRLMQAYIQMKQVEKAIQLLDEMEKNGIQLDSTTFIILITACANNNLLEQGEYLHNLALKTLDNFSIELSTSVVNFYTKCNQPEKAIETCKSLKDQKLMNTISWNCLIQAYIQMNQVEKAILLLDEMKNNNIVPSSSTFTILITACANNNLLEQGEYLHNLALKTLDNFSIELSTSVVNFYTKCNQPEKAIETCKSLKDQKLMNTISWNCLIQAYIQMKQVEKAILLLDEMKKNGIQLDSTTFIILITACANNNLLEQGEYLHNLALKTLDNFPKELSTSVVNFYTKCNQPEKAIEECNQLREKGLMDVVTWSCLINAHIQAADITTAIDLFQQMKRENVDPNIITYTILLSGCGDFVSQEKGLSIIQEIKNRGLDMSEEIVSSMINFYSKIGEKSKVEELIKLLQEQYPILSIITYNNILSHYAHHGNGIEAKKLFDDMVKKNVELNDQSFAIVLNSFSHCGMVSEAVNFFNDLQLKYNHKPSSFDIGAMIDVYSRAGLFEQAESLIGDEMNYIWWNTIMGGCRKFNNIQVGERAFSKLRSIQPTESSPFILMSHIYTYHGLNEKAEMIRNLMEKNGIKKIPGIVYHEENGHSYKFISGSTDYERYDEVEKMRNEIYRKIIQAGFKPDTKWVTHTKQITEEEKIDALCKHAEKTAIAHALVLNPKRKKILLTKNLRVCNDCHNATEFISKVFNIEIIVRDASRYHHFVNGKCSCNNYW